MSCFADPVSLVLLRLRLTLRITQRRFQCEHAIGLGALTQDREGPHLQGVYGRTSGSVQGFDYSGALRNAHVVWSDATLDRWLTDPDAFLPGNNMDFHVASPQERADLIRFLAREP